MVRLLGEWSDAAGQPSAASPLMEAASLGFILASASGLLLAAGTFWLARKSGLQPAQAALVQTLKENGDALEKQVGLLEREVATQRDYRVKLEQKVARLEAVVLELADENSDLRKKLGMGPRRHPLAVDAEPD